MLIKYELLSKLEHLTNFEINGDIFVLCTDNVIVDNNQRVYIYKLIPNDNDFKIIDINDIEFKLVEKYIKESVN